MEKRDETAPNENPRNESPRNENPQDDPLAGLRARIDETDSRLLELLNHRARLSLEVGRLKARTGMPVYRPKREEALLQALAKANEGPLRDGHLMAIYREILSASRDLQRTLHVAYLGPEGTFSGVACLEYFGRSIAAEAMPGLAEVFQAVSRRDCEFGIVPLENSRYGTVVDTLDLFAEHDVHIVGEWVSRIRLSLLSKERSLSDVGTVYSHSQPLGQCASWLRAHAPSARQVSVESTAAAARKASLEKGAAAVAHAALAGRFDLAVLAGNIEDCADNKTRFFIIGPGPYKNEGEEADKSSIVFALADKPGSLAAVLGILASAGLNLSKLESRPLRGEQWKYLFFADLDSDITAAPELLDSLREHCLRLRVLGAYAAATDAAAAPHIKETSS